MSVFPLLLTFAVAWILLSAFVLVMVCAVSAQLSRKEKETTVPRASRPAAAPAAPIPGRATSQPTG